MVFKYGEFIFKFLIFLHVLNKCKKIPFRNLLVFTDKKEDDGGSKTGDYASDHVHNFLHGNGTKVTCIEISSADMFAC